MDDDPNNGQNFHGRGEQPLSYIDGVVDSNGVNSNGELIADPQQANIQQQNWPNNIDNPIEDEVVQVVYQSNQHGSLVGVESSLVTLPSYDSYNSTASTALVADSQPESLGESSDQNSGGSILAVNQQHQQIQRVPSTLPSVAEESSGSASQTHLLAQTGSGSGDAISNETISRNSGQFSGSGQQDGLGLQQQQQQQLYSAYENVEPPPPYEETSYGNRYADQQLVGGDGIYSMVNKPGGSSRGGFSTFLPSSASHSRLVEASSEQQAEQHTSLVASTSMTSQISTHPIPEEEYTEVVNAEVHNTMDRELTGENNEQESRKENLNVDDAEISHVLYRHKQGAAESGSFRNNFRKKLGISVSSNENDLTTHRQKFLEAQEANGAGSGIEVDDNQDSYGQQESQGKFKRTHSVSFNVNSSRSNRHSVDIRNLPSYLTVKRASIVDVAKGAMSSLIHSFGSGASGSSSISDHRRRDSSPDDEPIFEEPIAPTLSLGQRVALMRSGGPEFGTVGWIGQLPDVDDDWIVGVIFDNMIGNCDGFYNGVRYFYSRENYAMFVPLSLLTKTDNYIGRPETGTMLSRMSVSLKPGQLISIQRSSIRLQHCFLNAPHQRVGHDVRAVSNRLHCQCHNCGPCAHLTKQSRINTMPHFGSHHLPKKKNSLAHAAVEVLAHHHHHYHEEEEAHDEEDHQFGDNTAHACNFVRYSCCQQSSTSGHNFSTDCGLVRPELLDNLIHAPRAPHRRHTRPSRRPRASGKRHQQQQVSLQMSEKLAIQQDANTLASAYQQDGTIVSTWTTTTTSGGEQATAGGDSAGESARSSRSSSPRSLISSGSSRTSSRSSRSSRSDRPYQAPQPDYTATMASYQVDQSTANFQNQGIFQTLDSQMSIIDQRRFVSQRDSSAMIRSQHSYISSEDGSYAGSRPVGLFSGIRRCFNCIVGRKSHSRANRRPKARKRKTSMRNRVIEYRRKQSTFVPSTLAKPHEDFATHGITLGSPVHRIDDERNNSDYSSYSHSSGRSSSRSSGSPRLDPSGDGNGMVPIDSMIHNHATMTMEHNIPTTTMNGNLKSGNAHNAVINYDDYSFDDRQEKHKSLTHEDSALTDLGFCETCCTLSSNDTLKSLVDKSINEVVSLPEPLNLNDCSGMSDLSPVISNDGNETENFLANNEGEEQVSISSPTVSCEDEMCQNIDALDINHQGEPDESGDQQ